MKVLKRVPWSLVYTCSGCKSELEIEASDVMYGSFGCYDDSETRYYVKCVVCGDSKFIDAKGIPTDIKNNAKKG